jgi:hypothetical protein
VLSALLPVTLSETLKSEKGEKRILQKAKTALAHVDIDDSCCGLRSGKGNVAKSVSDTNEVWGKAWLIFSPEHPGQPVNNDEPGRISRPGSPGH